MGIYLKVFTVTLPVNVTSNDSIDTYRVCGRDVNETFSFKTETRPRPFETKTETFFEMSQTVGLQPAKLLASNCYKLCCVSFIYYAKKGKSVEIRSG